MKCLVYAFIILMIAGCDIESAIDDAGQRCEYAGQRCEDEIANIIQSIESSCLTKDELFDIIDSVRNRNNQDADCTIGEKDE